MEKHSGSDILEPLKGEKMLYMEKVKITNVKEDWGLDLQPLNVLLPGVEEYCFNI